MKIYYLGHACFHIKTDSGINIITDPYEPGCYGGSLRYSEAGIEPDIATVSHNHPDHSFVKNFPKAKIVNTIGLTQINDLKIEGILSYHDKINGGARGKNIIFIINCEGFRIAHFGDLGTTNIDYKKLENIDIMLLPVGGNFTIDAKDATAIWEKITPKICVPMHFKTHKLDFDITSEEDFINGKDFERREYLNLKSGEQNLYNKKIIVLNFQR